MKKSIVLIVLIFGSYVTVFAQVKIKGKITDAANGSAVAGATIKVRGENSSAVSASDGSFELTAKSNNTLDISEVGYFSQSIKYKRSGEIYIRLVQDQKSLSEVVVTGVGVATSRKKVAIDVASLNIKDAGKSSVASVEQALQGKIAGVNVQFTSGTPGAAATVVLRGINDLSGNGPIILVDGIEVQGGLTGLDLSSIEKIEVVKGAAGGTLYGAQGANGVIQLFTKKGARNKKPVITIQSQLTSDQVLRGKQLLANRHSYNTDSDGFIVSATGQRLASDTDNAWHDPAFSDAGLSAYAAANTKNDKAYRERVYDHLGQAYQKAITSNTNLTIAGGSENADYAFAVGVLNQQNVLYNGYKRFNLGSNLGFTLAKGLNIRSNTQIVYTNEDLLSGGNRFNLTNSWKFIDFTAKDSKGNTVVKPKLDENQLNPLTEREWRTRESKTTRILQNINLNYKLNRFLEFDYKYGIELNSGDFNNLYKNQRTAPQSSGGFWGANLDGSVTDTLNKFTYQNSLATAYLKFDFVKEFRINIPINSTTQVSYDWRKIENRMYFAQGSILPSYPPYNISVAASKTSGDLNSSFITYGTLINQTFDYGKYAGVSGGMRRDFSSEFGEAKNAQTFYRGTVYFRPSELIKTSWLGDWKLRAAYGEAGIQPFTSLPFARQVVFNVNTIGIGGVGLGLPTRNANAHLKLATTNELEIGTDATINTGFKTWITRFNVSATYWKRKASDSYQFADLSPSTGSAQVFDNLTTLASKGLDFSLDADITQLTNFSWTFGFRYGQFDVVAEKISNNAAVVAGIFSLKEGEKVGSFFSQYPLTSLDQLQADKKTRYIAEADKSNYEIVNGMVVDTATKKVFISSPNDTKLAGTAYPKFNASFINNFTILKNITINLQFDWRYGSNIYNLTRQWLYRDRLSADYDKPVTIGGQTGAFVNYYNSLYNSVSPISWFVESASMLRLRDASVSYNLSEKYRPKWLRSAGLTIAARNLFTITKYSGLDPEATNTNDSQGNVTKGIGAINGVDLFAVPNLKSYIITLNLGF